MTDKQIIIDDCPHFIGGCCQEYLDGVCENHKCNLKIIRELEQKLKAKEQECEELKNFHINLVGVKECEIKELLKLKAENEKLDTENKRLVAELANPVFDSFEELDKLKQTLTEIKEIIHFNKTNRLSGGTDISIEQILQKISEVKDDNA